MSAESQALVVFYHDDALFHSRKINNTDGQSNFDGIALAACAYINIWPRRTTRLITLTQTPKTCFPAYHLPFKAAVKFQIHRFRREAISDFIVTVPQTRIPLIPRRKYIVVELHQQIK